LIFADLGERELCRAVFRLKVVLFVGRAVETSNSLQLIELYSSCH
jgi:hypothetical protein